MPDHKDDAEKPGAGVAGSVGGTQLLPDENRIIPTTTQHLVAGTQIGAYRIIAPIAAGGFGAVYKVEDSTTGELAALKLLHSEKSSSPEIVLRFYREGHVMQMLSHPNVVQVHELGVYHDGRPFIVMEYLEGVALSHYVRDKRRLPLSETVSILLPLCHALSAAHKLDIIHRDIKASNVFLAREPNGERRVVLLDFGVAKLCSNDELSLTTSRHAIGTPSSMAPEQIRGKAVDARAADVYGLGNLFFHLLAGKLPFADMPSAMVQNLHLHTPVPLVSGSVPVSTEVDKIIQRAMAKDPDQRYQTVDEFLVALEGTGEVPPARLTRPTQEERGFLVFFAEIVVAEELLDDPDDSLLEDMETVLPRTEKMLREHGFGVALTLGNSLLMTRGLPAEDENGQERKAMLCAAVEVAQALAHRASRDQRVHVNLCLHVVRGAGAKDQATRFLAWAPRGRVDGLLATVEATTTLAATGQAVPDVAEFRRLD